MLGRLVARFVKGRERQKQGVHPRTKEDVALTFAAVAHEPARIFGSTGTPHFKNVVTIYHEERALTMPRMRQVQQSVLLGLWCGRRLHNRPSRAVLHNEHLPLSGLVRCSKRFALCQTSVLQATSSVHVQCDCEGWCKRDNNPSTGGVILLDGWGLLSGVVVAIVASSLLPPETSTRFLLHGLAASRRLAGEDWRRGWIGAGFARHSFLINGEFFGRRVSTLQSGASRSLELPY
jgi:hypothetical protein